MNEIRNVIHRTVDILEQDNRGVQLGCYSVALVGLSIAIRRVRPFSKFRKPSDIPNHFIKERKELTGLVERIEPSGALLMIQHKPLLSIPGLRGGQLPVKISGVKVSSLGITWLQTVVTGHEVTFIPIAKDEKFVQCQVLLSQIRKNKPSVINIGESLVKVGFGKVANVEKNISQDPDYVTYYNHLQKAEIYALRKQLGMKYYINPTLSVLIAILKSFNTLLWTSYKHIIQIPKMPAS